MFKYLKKIFYTKILHKKYYRTGKCLGCGRCCKKIYVKNFKHVITDEKEFERLQYVHRFYSYLKVIGKDETGLIFECTKLDPITNKCKIHKSRPSICRRYPQEEMLSIGGSLSDNCGYHLEPIISFSEVFEKISKNFRL